MINSPGVGAAETPQTDNKDCTPRRSGGQSRQQDKALSPKHSEIAADSPSADIFSPHHKADPFPFYAPLRAESPVHPVSLPDRQTAWLVTRYDDATPVLKDARFAKNKRNALTPEQRANLPWVPAFFRPLARNMLDLDEPDHTRLRTLAGRPPVGPMDAF
jgi:cytochrome P450